MEFVKVMEIAARLYDNGGMPVSLPDWFENAFNFGYTPKTDDFSIAERELLAWEEQHPARPTLTPEQSDTLKWLRAGGFKWVTMGDDDKRLLKAYEVKPEFAYHVWQSNTSGMMAKVLFTECLRPLLPDWTKALEIDKALEENA